MVSRLFSSEIFTSSGRTPGTSATIFTASWSSNTSQAGIQDDVNDPFSWDWNGQELKASSRIVLRRRRLAMESTGRREMVTDMLPPPLQGLGSELRRRRSGRLVAGYRAARMPMWEA